ncbi:hypothetical protein QTI17_20190 [Variovorax sp. J31P179]|uniref:hypothetical protein n=1 Tax=Variovorax sp. J31P179 TaxID=3053508 RepID=UPI0025789628|nr:hypothetical protein [Variovorax sp. J31P179]MDM0082917.1 hypothetical protein [Variovorax sp. J31P179]
MSLSKSLQEPKEARLLAEDEERPCAYGYQIRSRALTFENDVLQVKLKFSENHKRGTLRFNFATAYLPPNLLHPKITLLKDRPDLARIIVAVVDSYLIRQQNTKSTATTSMTLAATVVRFLEYCWINEIYHLKDVSEGRWNDFLHKYTEGGWPQVLELERRSSAIDLRTIRVGRRRQKKGVVEYTCLPVLEAIGANVAESQVRLEYSRGTSKGVLLPSRGAKRTSQSSVAQVVGLLNNLVDLPRDMRAPSLAHVNPYLYAESMNAIPTNRTDNFEPDELAKLICEAYRWVNDYAGPILKLIERVYAELTAREQEDLDESRMVIMLEAPERLHLETTLGVRLTSVRRVGDLSRGSIGVLGLTRTLLAACFVVLGIFNGRRKDEVQSRSIGLYADSFECLDKELGLFQSYFYCEKSAHDYQSFFVNEISFKALNVAKALSDIAWTVARRNGGQEQTGRARKIFCMPPRSNEIAPVWYDYSTDIGIKMLLWRATGTSLSVTPNAHMFRRGYATVFHYRYENSDLYALSQKLDHQTLAMTIHYVLDGPSRKLARHAATLWNDGAGRSARAIHAAELAKEIKDYAKVKLHDDVLEILTATNPVSGGFTRLVHRFTRKMYGRIKYDDDDLRRVARGVTDIFLSRGHAVTPFPHGNCNAGPAKRGACCYAEGRLARERASAITCSKCPYHSMKEAHFQAIQEDLAQQTTGRARWPNDSLQAHAAGEALKATEKLVHFYARGRAANITGGARP